MSNRDPYSDSRKSMLCETAYVSSGPGDPLHRELELGVLQMMSTSTLWPPVAGCQSPLGRWVVTCLTPRRPGQAMGWQSKGAFALS
jgi:hypothetical protein